MESSTSSQPNHPCSPVNRINLDMDFEQNIFSQDSSYSQDYSMGYGLGHGSTHGSAPVNNDEEDRSPVEKVSPVKPKKPSRRAARAKKDDPKAHPKDWTVVEEIASASGGINLNDEADEAVEETQERSYSSTTIGTPTNEAHYQLRLNVFRQKGQPRLENTTRLHLESNSQKLQEVSKHLIMQWLAGQGFVQLVLFGLSASTNISSLARGSFVSTVE
nr:hypothetical protein [Tanacetum cinerariifolium]